MDNKQLLKKRILITTVLGLIITVILGLSLYNLIQKRYDFYTSDVFQENDKKIYSGNQVLSFYFSRFEDDAHLVSDLVTDELTDNQMNIESADTGIKAILKRVMTRNEFIYQIRILDANGYETIRFEKKNLTILESEDLQYKGERYYFTESLKVARDDLYITEIDLNVEDEVVQRPIVPTVRMTKKIYVKDEFYALVVINFEANLLFDQIDQQTNESGKVLEILNSNGYWLNHDDTDQEWGFMFNNKMNVNMKYRDQELWNFIKENTDGDYFYLDNILSFAKLKYTNEHEIILLSYLSRDDFLSKEFMTLFTYVAIHVFILVLFLIIVIMSTKFYYTRVIANEKLEQQALYDVLTKLPNRLSFNKQLAALVASSADENKFAVFFLDLDGFKNVNDSYGHEVGDKVLIDVAHRLRRQVRESDQVFRLGGDEFTLLIDKIKLKSDVEIVAKKIIDTISHRYVYDDVECKIGVSIGIAVYPDDATTETALLNFSDDLMYEVKRRGKNNYHYIAEALDH